MKNRFSSIRSGLAMLLVVSGACVASQGEPPPPEGVGVATQALAPAVTVAPALTYSLPAATPVTLSEATVDDFIAFAAAARKDQRFDIVSRIVAARCPATGACAILDALHDRILNPRRPGELGLQLITLKIIGEFGDVRSKATLVSYINAAMPPADEAEYAHLAINARMASEMLKARAVEALAFIATTDCLSEVFTIATSHPSQVVRGAAIRAYIHNSPNPATAQTAIKAAVAALDKPVADAFEKPTALTAAQFDSKLATYHAAYPPNPEPPTVVQKNHQFSPKPPADDTPPAIVCAPGVDCRYQ